MRPGVRFVLFVVLVVGGFLILRVSPLRHYLTLDEMLRLLEESRDVPGAAPLFVGMGALCADQLRGFTRRHGLRRLRRGHHPWPAPATLVLSYVASALVDAAESRLDRTFLTLVAASLLLVALTFVPTVVRGLRSRARRSSD